MTEESHVHDVLIIGAGPCGLAVAARLHEPYPSALFTDSEHQKFHFLRRFSHPHPHPPSKPIRTSRRQNTSLDRLLPGPSFASSSNSANKGIDIDIAVLDKHSSSWLSVWNNWFAKLRIETLRSPLFFHVDPGDRDALRGFAWREGRERELVEIKGVVGRELSKWARRKKVKNGNGKGKQAQENTYLDERDRNDYFRPSQALFKGHCEEVASRYGISAIVEKSELQSVSYDALESVFTLRTSTGVKKSRIAVLATGAGALPSIPLDSPFHGIETQETVKHVFSSPSPTQNILPKPLLAKLAAGNKYTSIAIIGGGLTSAQLASLASQHGVHKIHLIVRGKLKVKHFDVDLCWLAKFKNESMSRFWMADEEEERWDIMRDARGGGSVNPEFRDVVRRLVKEGKLVLWEDTKVQSATWETAEERWKMCLVTNTCRTVGEDEAGGQEEIDVDAVIYATGAAVDFGSIKAIQPLLQAYPIETVAGLPCLTKELMWNDEVPFFVTGRLGGLRLGPAAGNLEGARIGAELVAGRILGLLGTGRGVGRAVDERRMGLGIENSFGVLGGCCEDCGNVSSDEIRAML